MLSSPLLPRCGAILAIALLGMWLLHDGPVARPPRAGGCSGIKPPPKVTLPPKLNLPKPNTTPEDAPKPTPLTPRSAAAAKLKGKPASLAKGLGSLAEGQEEVVMQRLQTQQQELTTPTLVLTIGGRLARRFNAIKIKNALKRIDDNSDSTDVPDVDEVPKSYSGLRKLNAEEAKDFGGGAVSTMLIREDSGSAEKFLWKVEGPALQGASAVKGLAAPAYHTGIPVVGANLSGRAAASSWLDRRLKTNVLSETDLEVIPVKGKSLAEVVNESPDAEPAFIVGQKQKIVDKVKTGSPFFGDRLDDATKMSPEQRTAFNNDISSKQMLVDRMKIGVVDYLTNQNDRHSNNILKTSDGHLKAIDHDFSFGAIDVVPPTKAADLKPGQVAVAPTDLRYLAKLPKAIDQETAAEIDSLVKDIGVFKIQLANRGITSKEIETAENRLRAVHAGIQPGGGIAVIDVNQVSERDLRGHLGLTRIPPPLPPKNPE